MAAKAGSRKRAPRKKAATTVSRQQALPEPLAESPPPEPATGSPAREPLPVFAAPEVEFAARAPAVQAERPRPVNRRAIFIDVENESHARRLEELLSALQIDRGSAATDLIASGNWRVISNETARLLAKKGALLVHSAPATGVRDWSDLRIAVAAGAWLAAARPGDRLDIVSSDRAFDAVGDVAATLGVEFHRHAHKAGERPSPARPNRTTAAKTPPTSGRRGRGRKAASPRTPPASAARVPAGEPPAEAQPTAQREELVNAATGAPASLRPAAERVAAPEDELLSVVRELLLRSPSGVWLDAIAAQLKERGFERPPNSPRLVTRLRSTKGLRVSPQGKVTLGG
jgi:hypothetical protein